MGIEGMPMAEAAKKQEKEQESEEEQLEAEVVEMFPEKELPEQDPANNGAEGAGAEPAPTPSLEASQKEEQEGVRHARVEELRAEIENFAPKEEAQKQPPSQPKILVSMSNQATANGEGGGKGSGSTERSMLETMKKPSLLKRLLLALFGIPWEKERADSGNNRGDSAAASSSSEMSIELGNGTNGRNPEQRGF